MACNISEKRIEQLKEMQNKLTSLNNEIQKIIDGKSSMKELANYLNLTQQRLNTEINNGIFPLLRNVKILDSNGIEQLLMDSSSPIERLMNCVLATSGNEMIILDMAEEDIIMDILNKALNKKERVVIFNRFGLIDGHPKLIKEIAAMLEVTPERIRQIESKALGKLRNPIWLRRLLPNYSLRIQALNECYAIKALDKKLTCEENITDNNINRILEVDLVDFDINTRAYNALKRAGVKTIGDLSKFTIYDLMKVRNLGRKSLEEIVIKLERIGITLDDGINDAS